MREIEKQVKWIVEQIHGISDLEQLSEAGLEEKLEQRLQKQNPEGIRKLHELENQQEIRNSY